MLFNVENHRVKETVLILTSTINNDYYCKSLNGVGEVKRKFSANGPKKCCWTISTYYSIKSGRSICPSSLVELGLEIM